MNCLDILNFKCFSEQIDPTKLYVENFVDINSTELSHLADEFTLNGKKLGEQMLLTAQNNVSADIAMINTSLRLNSKVEMVNNKWGFSTGTDTGDKGIRIVNTSNSPYAVINISSIRFKPKFSGTFDILIDYGRDTITHTVTAVANTINVFELDYSSKMTMVTITAINQSKEFFNLVKTDKSCSSCSGKKYNIIEQGYLNGASNQINAKFIVEAFLSCEITDLVCLAVKNNNIKIVIAKLLAYQLGIDYYTKMLTSTRLNETTTQMTKDDIRTFIDTLEGKYKFFLYGDNRTSYGMAKMLENYLKTNNDYCIQCNAKNYVVKATF